MRRIMIMGAACAGKSTLAQRLGERLDLTVVHLDKLYWTPGWEHATKDEFREKQLGEFAGDTWVTDGNYTSSIDVRLARADTVLFLTSPTPLAVWRIFARWWEYRGRTRSSMTEGCIERVDWEFFWYVLNFNRTRVPHHLALAREAVGEDRVIVLRDRAEIDAFLATVEG